MVLLISPGWTIRHEHVHGEVHSAQRGRHQREEADTGAKRSQNLPSLRGRGPQDRRMHATVPIGYSRIRWAQALSRPAASPMVSLSGNALVCLDSSAQIGDETFESAQGGTRSLG